MALRRGWVERDGWWRKKDWDFEFKFAKEIDKKFEEDKHFKLQIHDVAEYVTHVQAYDDEDCYFEVFIAALKSSRVSLWPNLISLDLQGDLLDTDMLSLAECLSSGKLPKLSRLDISGNDIGNQGAKSLGVAIRSGELKNLAELFLESTGIEDEGLTALAESSRESEATLLPNLTSLDLSSNSFTEVGLLEFAECLSSGKLPKLSRLDISYNFIRNEGARSLGLAIRSGELKNLAKLILENTGIEDEGLTALAESFRESEATLLPNLTSLNLSSNSFTEVGLLEFAECLSSGKLPKLSRLDISENKIGNKGARSLGLAIRSGELKNLAELILENTRIKDEGLTALAESFRESEATLLPNLTSLNLSNNSFTEVGLLELAECLSSGKLPKLSRLDISYNSIGNEGARSLGLAIRSGELKNLAKLILENTRIEDEGLTALAESFRESEATLLPNLTSLNLSNNSFTEVGLLELAECLSSGKLPKLSHFDVSGNKIGDEGARSLGLAIRSGELKNLTSLNLSNNSFTEVGQLELAECLSSGKLPKLSLFDDPRNSIGNQFVKSLGVAIRSGELKNLTGLSLTWKRIGDEGLIALSESFQEGLLPNLILLNLGGNHIQQAGMFSLAECLSSGKLPKLSRLDISENDIGNKGARSLGLAIRSGELKNLAELFLESTGIEDEGLTALAESFRESEATLLPKLTSLNLSYNSFTKVGLLELAEALIAGCLNHLTVLDIRSYQKPSKKAAHALVSAFSTNNCLTADVKFEWDRFPELDRHKRQLIERNSRNRDILDGLVEVPKVQATFGKVYICGNPEVGKTTLRRTLQRSFWKSLYTWERKPRVEVRTRGIDVSQLSSQASKPDETPITLLVWDMAGQEDFHLVHNAFFPDLGFAEGKATTFIVVCRFKNSLQDCLEQLEYWLRYIASSCDKFAVVQNPRQVFVVMNNTGGDRKIHTHAEQWKLMLERERDKFQKHLQIQTKLFLIDVRKFKQVAGLKSCLLRHASNFLRNQEVPDICQTIQKNLNVLCTQTEHFPVLHWTKFVEQVKQLLEPWSEHVIEAAAKYLNEAGVIIYIDRGGVKLVVVDPNWFCREIIGKVFLPREMASPRELIFREEVDQRTGSISISSFKKFFNSLEGEWNDTQVDDMIAILLWLGLCYKGKDENGNENVFIPALIDSNGTPGGPWGLQIQVEHGVNQWVMGFSVRHRKSEVTLAPISLWHRFQVDLAQTLKFESEVPDNDFVADKHFMTFNKDYMNVLIEVDANLDKPTFEEISILVKPSNEREELHGDRRKQLQVDLADDLVERLLQLWSQYCPGVEYVTKVIWPWPVSWSRPEDITDRNVHVEQVKQWVKTHGMGRRMQWLVGSGDVITADQLLSTKDKKSFSSSETSGIEGHARQVNDSVFELHMPKNIPKVQIVFFHGLQKEDYSDAHLSTWRIGDGSSIWPQTLLVEEIPEARVLSISYSGGLRDRSDGSPDMYLIVENLLSDLVQDGIGQVPQCQVILVGHSIGGLVIKALCNHAHEKLSRSQGSQRAKLEIFLKSVKGIFYYATPHRGSGVAKILAKKISNPLLPFFEMLSKDTARLNSDFEDMCKAHYKHWSFAGLGEAVPTNLGPLKGGVACENYWVVPEASARGENFNVVEGADHFSVCRPRSKTVRSFTKLRDFVFQIARNATDAEKMKPANPLSGSSSSETDEVRKLEAGSIITRGLVWLLEKKAIFRSGD